MTISVLHLLHDDSGQDLIEYALVGALVALGSVAATTSLANSVGHAFNRVQDIFSDAVS
jgi:pilus assembly protein Flp/PilA